MSTTSVGRLNKRHAILTGAGGGIGAAVAAAFLREGALCTIVDISAQPSQAVKDLAAQYPEQVLYVGADLTKAAERERVVAEGVAKFGPIHVLHNNAAIFDMAPLLEGGEDMYDKMFAVNVKAAFFMMQAVLKNMVENKTRGAIINMSSQAGRRGEPLVSHYCASKAAIISYTQSAALAMAPHHIRVNAIAPGVIDTPMWGGDDALFAKYEHLAIGEKKIQVGKAVPLGYMGAPNDIAGAVVFLASDEASYITGASLPVDGGRSSVLVTAL